ncbi:MAG: hypothetical protein ACT4PJ_11840 [Gemmatimonadaceae bacterium]
MNAFDSAVVLHPSPRLMVDGHHGAAIEAAMREVLGDTYDLPPTQHRYARKQLVVARGDLIVPRGTGWRLHSIRDLDIVLEPGAQVIGYGAMPAVVTVDACSYGRFDASRGAISPRRPDGAARLDVPTNGFVIQKSIVTHDAPNQTHFTFTGKIGGLWRDAGYSGGSPTYTTAQEDHFLAPLIQVFGNYDIHGDLSADADLCRLGASAGNEAFSNNRRHYYGLVHVAWCESAFRALRTAVTIERLIADGCRDYFVHNASRVAINGGEAEACGRLLNDQGFSGHDFPLVVRDVYAKLDAWKRGMGGVQEQYRDSAFGVWGTRGNCYLQNVAIGSLPVRRTDSGTLRHMDGGAPPKLWTAQPTANVFLEHGTTVHGYRRSEVFAFEAQGSGTARSEIGWKDTDPDGFVRRTMMDPSIMRAPD